MHRALTGRLLRQTLRVGEAVPSAGVPLYLCPAVAGLSSRLSCISLGAAVKVSQRRTNHTEAISSSNESTLPPAKPTDSPLKPVRRLPLTCSGCGAFTQTEDPEQLGYLDVTKRRVREWMNPPTRHQNLLEGDEDKIVNETLGSLDQSRLKELGLDPAMLVEGGEPETEVKNTISHQKAPVCDRCHDLLHHSTKGDTAKVTMYHPTVESLRETIEESPHKYNHIYHVIDAADFPMSLIPRLNVLLGDVPLRTRNRRSRAGKFQHDRKTEMSFIITRSDLLGPTKEMVDAMMPYLKDVLRQALGRVGERIRLGNVRCVSARRGWWTTTVKEDVWNRGGAGWMVGKVNVGKSQLFEAIYPKGRMIEKPERASVSTNSRAATANSTMDENTLESDEDLATVNLGSLLPPPQPAKNYPDMPIVSSLPGTTASPIRIPFGNGKGELIDLPGLARSDLELYVKEEHRQSLIMKKRIVPEQITVKPGSSIILGGGLIRITPRTPDMIFLMYNFTPLHEHLTSTDKAIEFQDQTRQSIGLENITLPDIGDKMKHAGTFKLEHDVTKKRAGPLTRKNAIGLSVDTLPFRVLSVDILIEGVGYVEIVAQVRKRHLERILASQNAPAEAKQETKPKATPQETNDPFADMYNMRRDMSANDTTVEPKVQLQPEESPEWPAVDVYSPLGKFIGSRKPINGWLNNKPRETAEQKKSRPRRSMKGAKKLEKKRRGEHQAA
ncbi:hypothetical protein M441DRAFT_189304 [Trichoderma asperellum CBS 433.97]|uniref:Genetic interactor of prohibitins 3, mitochondrial n=1 Tax=Trichoderma asperellum (strain ATCC 204424 / CBS 433.97 / NBRC 101777) TaxID=1042311 RepID=A0A2T3ZF37_TRIA4|nr:hypothetical protein M441DRAFT_189304 [Trichoderma asperellum CBS 433.97]PTB43414.1 hypothetical protein M441DRAFT_189304 [Trichoderma asperellum CBS 433.97]